MSNILARRLWISLVKIDNQYSVLSDGHFLTTINAENDEEAIKIFNERKSWREEK